MPVAPPAVDAATDTRGHSAPLAVRIPGREGKPHGDRQQRVAGLLGRVLRPSYLDPLFERPDIIEDDYYRFLNQPRG